MFESLHQDGHCTVQSCMYSHRQLHSARWQILLRCCMRQGNHKVSVSAFDLRYYHDQRWGFNPKVYRIVVSAPWCCTRLLLELGMPWHTLPRAPCLDFACESGSICTWRRRFERRERQLHYSTLRVALLASSAYFAVSEGVINRRGRLSWGLLAPSLRKRESVHPALVVFSHLPLCGSPQGSCSWLCWCHGRLAATAPGYEPAGSHDL